MKDSRKLDTLCVQAGYNPKPGEPRVPPVVQSTTYFYDDPSQLGNLFDLKESGFFYSRIGNPTNDALEQKVAALEGGAAALSLSSGQAASTFAVLNVCGAGDHVISSQAVYGGTFNLFAVTLKKLGIDVTFLPADASEPEISAAVRPNTKLIFGETVANPAIKVLDFESYAAAAKKHGILFAVDNTLATPVHCRPLEHGANVVVHSSTKYLDGHARSVGGILVDGGNFEFIGNPRYPGFNEPDESYHGLVFGSAFGSVGYIVKARVQLLRDLGSCMAPMNAFLTHMGAETLHLRMERTSGNALRVAEYLAAHPKVSFVKYPFLKGDENQALAKKYLSGGAGGMLSFGVKSGRAGAEKFIKSLKLVALVTHIADIRSSVIHPASTTHRQLSDAALVSSGVSPEQVRFSAGIEHIDDILADLGQALGQI